MYLIKQKYKIWWHLDFYIQPLAGVCYDGEFGYYYALSEDKQKYKLFWLPEDVLIDFTSNAILYCKWVGNHIIPNIKKPTYIGNYFEFYKRKKDVHILNEWYVESINRDQLYV